MASLGGSGLKLSNFGHSTWVRLAYLLTPKVRLADIRVDRLRSKTTNLNNDFLVINPNRWVQVRVQEVENVTFNPSTVRIQMNIFDIVLPRFMWLFLCRFSLPVRQQTLCGPALLPTARRATTKSKSLVWVNNNGPHLLLGDRNLPVIVQSDTWISHTSLWNKWTWIVNDLLTEGRAFFPYTFC